MPPKIEMIEMKDNQVQINIPPDTPKTRNDIENNWDVGCLGKLDKRCITYFSQLLILSSVIAVSLVQVSTKTDNREFWISLLCSSIGVLVPNPKMSKKD
jgi:hypothetical protein